MTDAPADRLFVVYTRDRPGAAELRAQTRPGHIAFMKTLGSSALIGGPLLDDDGETRNGGMYMLRAASLDEARAIAARDPFVVAGLFATADVCEWLWQTNNIA
ncbi:MAG: YciI family protein [Novosphingobium sp.]